MDSMGANELTKLGSEEFVGCKRARQASSEAASNLISINSSSGSGKLNLVEEEQLNEEDEKLCSIQGKENQNKDERLCHSCQKSLSKARHLINIAGQTYKWHPECFKCNVCHQPMDRANTCYIYKDKIVCRDDYLKLQHDNSFKCSRCRWPIGASDWVRKAGDFVYHLACFSCDICLRQMSTGEQFTVNIQDRNAVRLLCRLHFAIEPQGGSTTSMDTSHQDCTNNTHPPALPGPFEFTYRHQCSPAAVAAAESRKFSQQANQQDKQQRQQQQHYLHLLASTSQAALLLDRKSELMSDEELMDEENQLAGVQQKIGINSSPSSNGSNSALVSGLPSKSKRVRTTFTEDQLSYLQKQFQKDSNPDGQDLERIATITGLSKRVTQVWFQNSRARQKKYMIKRKPSSSSSTVSASLVPKTMGLATGNSSLQYGGNGGGVESGLHHHHHHHHHQHSQQQHQRFQSEMGPPGHEESENAGDFYQQKWSNMSNRSDLSVAIEDIDDQASRISFSNKSSSSSSGSRTPSRDGQLIVSDHNSNE